VVAAPPVAPAAPAPAPAAPKPVEPVIEVKAPEQYASEKIGAVASFKLPVEKAGETIQRVTLGATSAEGGTRKKTVTLGGQNCLPFHYFEGAIPNLTAYALEVFDTVSPKISPELREVWGDSLSRPAEMAQRAVSEFGADVVAVRLEGTHPEKGAKSADEALALVKDVLAAVDVPLLITGHSHFDATNDVMRKIAQGCEGERLLLNWVEADNYRTIAGAALAYGHCVVAQSPIDVNIAKQLNILLGNMDFPRDRIVMDPMTGALGYGLEYTYSVMERIRLTGLGGDTALTLPMVTGVGQEAWKVKEGHAAEADFPAWGARDMRSMLWEVQTAMPLILAGADLVILNHPGSLAALRRNVDKLAQWNRPENEENR
jgi:acetyl-CoA decarbonylase/synthase complex subunit delta